MLLSVFTPVKRWVLMLWLVRNESQRLSSVRDESVWPVGMWLKTWRVIAWRREWCVSDGMSFGHWTDSTLQFTPAHNQLRAQMKGTRQWQHSRGREEKMYRKKTQTEKKNYRSKHWRRIIRGQDLVMPCAYSIPVISLRSSSQPAL